MRPVSFFVAGFVRSGVFLSTTRAPRFFPRECYGKPLKPFWDMSGFFRFSPTRTVCAARRVRPGMKVAPVAVRTVREER